MLSHDRFTRWIEGKGIGLRKYLCLSPYEILDPFKLAKSMDVHVLSIRDAEIPNDVKDQLIVTDPTCWDAFCIPFPEEKALIIYNPTHASTRIRSTIMEELAHLYLKHKGSKLIHADGICYRNYKKSNETQAYAVGAAALLPMSLLRQAKNNGLSKSSFALECKVSPELVTYRGNITNIRLH